MVGRAGIRALAVLLLALMGPSACASPPISSMTPLTISGTLTKSPRQNIMVAADGGLNVAGKPTTLDRLPADLDAAFKDMRVQGDRADQTVIIVAGPAVSYVTFMGVVGAVIGAGWIRIGMVMLPA